MATVTAKSAVAQPEREIFHISREEELSSHPRVKRGFFSKILDCFRGKNYIEVEEEAVDAFEEEIPGYPIMHIDADAI